MRNLLPLVLLITIFIRFSTPSPFVIQRRQQDLPPPLLSPPPQSNRRFLLEALFSNNVSPAAIVPKNGGLGFWWLPHAYFNLCDTVNQNEDSLWAYGCSPMGPGPNSILPGANIPPPTFPYDEVDDKGVGILRVPLPKIHPDIDYAAALIERRRREREGRGRGGSGIFGIRMPWDSTQEGSFFG